MFLFFFLSSWVGYKFAELDEMKRHFLRSRWVIECEGKMQNSLKTKFRAIPRAPGFLIVQHTKYCERYKLFEIPRKNIYFPKNIWV